MAEKIDIIGWQNLYASAGPTINEFVNVRKSYGTGSPIIGKLTKTEKWKVLSYGYKVGETDKDKWYALKMPSGETGFVRKDLLQFYTVTDKENYSEKELNTFLQDVVAINKSIYLRLLQSSVLIEVAVKQGKTEQAIQYANTLKTLNNRLYNRQKEIESNAYLKVKTVFEKAWEKGFNVYKKLLSNISGCSSIGAVPVIAAVVAGIAVVSGVAAYAVYQSLKPKYDSSVADLKQSDALKKALETLTADEKNEVVNDLEKQIDDAYNKGKSDSFFSGAWSVIKPIAFAVGGWYLIQLFIKKQSGRVQNG